MFVPLHDREYRTGDTGLLLVFGPVDGAVGSVAAGMALNRESVARRRADGCRLFLAECVVTNANRAAEGGADQDGADDFASVYYPRSANHASPPQHVNFFFQHNQVRNCFNMIRTNGGMMEDNQEVLEFLCNFVYPVITVSSGYRNMLRDIAVACGRDPDDAVLPADSAPILARAAELGVPVRKMSLRTCASAGFPQDIRERVNTSVQAYLIDMRQRAEQAALPAGIRRVEFDEPGRLRLADPFYQPPVDDAEADVVNDDEEAA